MLKGDFEIFLRDEIEAWNDEWGQMDEEGQEDLIQHLLTVAVRDRVVQ